MGGRAAVGPLGLSVHPTRNDGGVSFQSDVWYRRYASDRSGGANSSAGHARSRGKLWSHLINRIYPFLDYHSTLGIKITILFI